MKKYFNYLLFSALLFSGCMKHDFDTYENRASKDEINSNVKNVFGVEFDSNHDWCTTTNGKVTITGIPDGTEKVQIFACIAESDTTTSMVYLNEEDNVNSNKIALNYDAPNYNNGLYASITFNGNRTMKKITGDVVDFSVANTRAARRSEYNLPTGVSLKIESIIPSYAGQRGWIPNEVLYGMSDESYPQQVMTPEPYSTEYTELFRNVIFSYFKNGRQYNNLPLIKESGYFNDKVYPITTGGDPIIISPVYKCDKAKQYGNEIWNSDLYYYYFKESDLIGKDEVEYLKSLPKYKAIPFNQHFGESEDDKIDKRASYALIYWGDGTPELGTEGTYEFPEGYKIGFMVRANTEFKENGKPRKQGELYGDGRLNNEINNYSECNFKSSKLGKDGPRMGWITLEGKMLLCCESGTDADFNDIILEVEGGVEPIEFIPEFEGNSYTFCFEDREIGDYDLNDIVIKATRLNKTTVEYKIVACGANDALYIGNINGNIINSAIEVHSLFNTSRGTFINTVKGQEFDVITDVITVNENFSFLNESTQPYIMDETTGVSIHVSKKGEDPHGIMIPYDFKYPLEKVCIKNAYSKFNNWGQNRVTSTDWYKYPNEEYVW